VLYILPQSFFCISHADGLGSVGFDKEPMGCFGNFYDANGFDSFEFSDRPCNRFFAGSAVDTGHVGDISHFVRVLSIRIMSSDCWSKESKRESKDEGEMLIIFYIHNIF